MHSRPCHPQFGKFKGNRVPVVGEQGRARVRLTPHMSGDWDSRQAVGPKPVGTERSHEASRGEESRAESNKAGQGEAAPNLAEPATAARTDSKAEAEAAPTGSGVIGSHRSLLCSASSLTHHFPTSHTWDRNAGEL